MKNVSACFRLICLHEAARHMCRPHHSSLAAPDRVFIVCFRFLREHLTNEGPAAHLPTNPIQLPTSPDGPPEHKSLIPLSASGQLGTPEHSFFFFLEPHLHCIFPHCELHKEGFLLGLLSSPPYWKGEGEASGANKTKKKRDT